MLLRKYLSKDLKIQEKKLGSPYTGYFVDYKLNLIGLKNGIKEIYDKAN